MIQRDEDDQTVIILLLGLLTVVCVLAFWFAWPRQSKISEIDRHIVALKPQPSKVDDRYPHGQSEPDLPTATGSLAPTARAFPPR